MVADPVAGSDKDHADGQRLIICMDIMAGSAGQQSASTPISGMIHGLF
jgi:hypothetical protein